MSKISAIIGVMIMLIAAIGIAEVKIYEGVGKYIMSDFENAEIAKMRAKVRAEQNAKEQAGVFLTSYVKAENFKLTANEISAVTNTIANIVGDVKYAQKVSTVDDMPVVIYTATLQANIDTDGLENWIRLDDAERSELVNQNLNLNNAITDNDKKAEDLKQRYNMATSQSEKDAIKTELNAVDNEFMALQKFIDGKKFAYDTQYQEALDCYNESVKLNPNFADVYYERARIYFLSYSDNPLNESIDTMPEELIYAVDDVNKYLEFDPKNKTKALRFKRQLCDMVASRYLLMGNEDEAWKYLDEVYDKNSNDAKVHLYRGTLYADRQSAYVDASDFDAYQENLNRRYDNAIAEYNKAIELNPKLAEAYFKRADAYFNKGWSKSEFTASPKDMPNFNKAYADANKCLEIQPNHTGAKALKKRLENYLSGAEYHENSSVQDQLKALREKVDKMTENARRQANR